MSDLIARLTEGANDLSYEYSPGTVALIREAITEIERLREMLNKTAANSRTKARKLRRVKDILRWLK